MSLILALISQIRLIKRSARISTVHPISNDESSVTKVCRLPGIIGLVPPPTLDKKKHIKFLPLCYINRLDVKGNLHLAAAAFKV